MTGRLHAPAASSRPSSRDGAKLDAEPKAAKGARKFPKAGAAGQPASKAAADTSAASASAALTLKAAVRSLLHGASSATQSVVLPEHPVKSRTGGAVCSVTDWAVMEVSFLPGPPEEPAAGARDAAAPPLVHIYSQSTGAAALSLALWLEPQPFASAAITAAVASAAPIGAASPATTSAASTHAHRQAAGDNPNLLPEDSLLPRLLALCESAPAVQSAARALPHLGPGPPAARSCPAELDWQASAVSSGGSPSALCCRAGCKQLRQQLQVAMLQEISSAATGAAGKLARRFCPTRRGASCAASLAPRSPSCRQHCSHQLCRSAVEHRGA